MGVTVLDLDIRAIPLEDFMKALGRKSLRREGGFLIYNAPYADDRPTMSVDPQLNRWHDRQDGSHGDIYSLAAKITGSCDRSELNWFIASEMSQLRKVRVERIEPKSENSQRKSEREQKVKRKSGFRL